VRSTRAGWKTLSAGDKASKLAAAQVDTDGPTEVRFTSAGWKTLSAGAKASKLAAAEVDTDDPTEVRSTRAGWKTLSAGDKASKLAAAQVDTDGPTEVRFTSAGWKTLSAGAKASKPAAAQVENEFRRRLDGSDAACAQEVLIDAPTEVLSKTAGFKLLSGSCKRPVAQAPLVAIPQRMRVDDTDTSVTHVTRGIQDQSVEEEVEEEDGGEEEAEREEEEEEDSKAQQEEEELVSTTGPSDKCALPEDGDFPEDEAADSVTEVLSEVASSGAEGGAGARGRAGVRARQAGPVDEHIAEEAEEQEEEEEEEEDDEEEQQSQLQSCTERSADERRQVRQVGGEDEEETNVETQRTGTEKSCSAEEEEDDEEEQQSQVQSCNERSADERKHERQADGADVEELEDMQQTGESRRSRDAAEDTVISEMQSTVGISIKEVVVDTHCHEQVKAFVWQFGRHRGCVLGAWVREVAKGGPPGHGLDGGDRLVSINGKVVRECSERDIKILWKQAQSGDRMLTLQFEGASP